MNVPSLFANDTLPVALCAPPFLHNTASSSFLTIPSTGSMARIGAALRILPQIRVVLLMEISLAGSVEITLRRKKLQLRPKIWDFSGVVSGGR